MKYEVKEKFTFADSVKYGVTPDNWLPLTMHVGFEVSEGETTIGFVGVSKPMQFDLRPLIWFAPTEALRPIHWRGLKKLLPQLKAYVPDAIAFIEVEKKKTVKFAQALGLAPIEKSGKVRTFSWQ